MDKTPGDTPEERASYWVGIINEGRQYPSGVTAYCRDYNISKHNYYVWFGKLRASHPEWKNDLPQPRKQKRKKRTQPAPNVPPQIEVKEKATRRYFSAQEKARILAAADAAPAGQLGAVLRKEGIYASHLKKWRAERTRASLEPKKRGPQANPLTAEMRKLKAQNERLQRKLLQAEKIIDLQKKVSEILGVTLEEIHFEDED